MFSSPSRVSPFFPYHSITNIKQLQLILSIPLLVKMHFAATLLSTLALASTITAQVQQQGVEVAVAPDAIYMTVYENSEGQGNFETLFLTPQVCGMCHILPHT